MLLEDDVEDALVVEVLEQESVVRRRVDGRGEVDRAVLGLHHRGHGRAAHGVALSRSQPGCTAFSFVFKVDPEVSSGESMALEPTRQRRSKRPDRLSVEDPSFERELQRALALSKREEDAKWANANKRPTLFGAVGGADEAPAPPARKPPPPKKASPKAGGKRASSPGPAPAAKAGRKGDADARSTASGGSGGGGGKARGSSRKRAPTDADAALERTAYLGVEYNSSSGKYRATIRGRTGYDYCLGWYASATEAAACYDETARGLHGPGAETNFAPPPERRDLPLFDLSLPKSGKTATREEPRAEEKPRPLAWYEETVAAFLANERQKGVDV